MRSKFFNRLVFGLGILLLGSVQSAWSNIVLGTASSQWKAVMMNSIFDPDNDFSNSATDLVGNASHAHMYMAYDTAASASDESDDTLAFRFRIDKNPDFSVNSFKNGNLALGIDLNRDNALDLFLRLYGSSGGVLSIGVAESDPPKTNTSPSNSGFVNETALNSAKFSYSLVRTTTAGESWDSYPSQADWFFDVKIAWSELKAKVDTKHLLNGTALGALVSASTGSGGIGGLSRNTLMRFIVFSSVNSNNINGDVAGYNDATDDMTLSFASKGAFSEDQSFSNQKPSIISNGGGASASVNFAENGTGTVLTLQATDPEGATLSYSIGGTDHTLFQINSSTGELTFLSSPDYEAPSDAGANNTYDLYLIASDGAGGVDTQTVAVHVTNLSEGGNNPPVISGGNSQTASAAENGTSAFDVDATDSDGGTISYSLSGADSSLFNLNTSTGVLTFKTAPDYENPNDAGANRNYQVIITVSDGQGDSTALNLSLNLSNVNEAPSITSNGGAATASINLAENTSTATTVVGSDPDASTTLSYSISGGQDSAKFTINSSTGALDFVSAPDYENPSDGSTSGSNSYVVKVKTSDDTLFAEQTITVLISNVNEAPSITSNGGAATAAISINENSKAVTTVVASDPDSNSHLVFSLNGGGNATKYHIDSLTGVLEFNIFPDYENPSDGPLSGYNTYLVRVRVSDGSLYSEQLITTTILNVNEAPTNITLSDSTVAENAGAHAEIATLSGTDPDSASVLSYSLPTGVLDNSFFEINAQKLLAQSSFDFEQKNSYNIRIRVSDGSLTYDKDFVISIRDTIDNQNPVLSGGTSQSAQVYENALHAFDVLASDSDGGTLSYSLYGADSSLFTIQSSTGVISFKNAPDYENPMDQGLDRNYQLTVLIQDGQDGQTSLSLSLNLLNVNETPQSLALSSSQISENQAARSLIGILSAVDPDQGDSLRFELDTSLLDNHFFVLSRDSLYSVQSFNYEQKSNYQIQLKAQDLGGLSKNQEFTISILNLAETQQIHWDSIGTLVYGDGPISLKAHSDAGLVVEFRSEDTNTALVHSDSLILRKAGEIRVWAIQSGNTEYSADSSSIVLNIQKADLHLSSKDTSRAYGSANPQFSLSAQGWKNGDSWSSLETLPTFFCSATALSGVGDYPITVQGGSALNYRLIYDSSAHLTIMPLKGKITAQDSLKVQLLFGNLQFHRDTVLLLRDSSSWGTEIRYETSDSTKAKSSNTQLTLLDSGIVNLRIIAGADSNHIGDTALLQVRILWSNHPAELLSSLLTATKVLDAGERIGLLNTKDLDGDFVKLQLLNRTADFRLSGDTLYAKQRLDGSEKIFSLYFLVSDGYESHRDTLRLTVDPSNRPPELLQSSVHVVPGTKPQFLLTLPTADADGDALSIRLLNYTADFKITGDSLWNKQVLDGSETLFRLKLEISDGKSTIQVPFEVHVADPSYSPTAVWQGWKWSNQGFTTDASGTVQFMDINGEQILELNLNHKTNNYNLSHLKSGTYIVKWGVHSMIWRKL